MNNMIKRSLLLTGISLSTLQIGCRDFRDCSTVDLSTIESLPLLLSETNVYDDITNDTISSEAIAFTPQFPLWTDGATKRRWLILPEGTQVNTEDEDNWEFPIGTASFKEFSRDGVRVETRMNWKQESGWVAATYLWNESGSDAERQLDAIANASGTEHDIPSAAECFACHGGRNDFTLGFSATQLDLETRSQLYDLGLFSTASTSEPALTETQRSGLGVLHGNCSHCHNSSRNENPQATECYNPGAEEDFDLSLPPDLDSIEQAPALLTARHDFLRGDIIARMSARNQSRKEPSMPPLGTELVDEEGLAAVQRLIDELVASGH